MKKKPHAYVLYLRSTADGIKLKHTGCKLMLVS